MRYVIFVLIKDHNLKLIIFDENKKENIWEELLVNIKCKCDFAFFQSKNKIKKNIKIYYKLIKLKNIRA